MARRNKTFAGIALSVLLHVALIAAMVAAYDFARPTPITPMAISATLVTEMPDLPPLPAVAEEPEPEPVVEEPEPEPEPEPDNSEELRRQAEEEKRAEDALIEMQRLEELQKQKQEAERKKEEQEEAERKKQEREEAEQKRQEEEERKEREREEAERKRLEDIERQRQENERRRRELEEEQRLAELEAEERRFAARNSAEMDAYRFAIAQKIRRNWSAPASAGPETRCTVLVTQVPGGDIVGVTIRTCNGDDALKRSVEAAIRRSSPLPQPSNPDLFDRNLTLNLTLDRDE